MNRASEPNSVAQLAGATIGIFTTLALVVVGLTLMFLAMRSVMEIGGACADGGPFQPVRPCPNGVGLAMFGGVWGGIIALGAYFWLATAHRVPSLLALAWPALFLSLGWNFMEYGFNSPAPGGGLEWGWIFCGVLFWLMGGIPLLLVAPMLFRSSGRRIRRARSVCATRLRLCGTPRGRYVRAMRPAVERGAVPGQASNLRRRRRAGRKTLRS